MRVALLTAMDSEFSQIADLLEEKQEVTDVYNYLVGRIGDKEVVLSKCGMGKVNAAVSTTEMIRRFNPDAVISTGCAGGIDPSLSVMDIVVADRCVNHDVDLGEEWGLEKGHMQGMPYFFNSAETLVNAAKAIGDPSIHIGLICTGDQFITDESDLKVIKETFPQGLAVDMESGAISQTCYIFGVPFLSFRVISDTPGVDEHIQQYVNFWQQLADKSFNMVRQLILNI